MANAVYNGLKTGLMNGDINLGSDTLKLALVSAAYTPNIDTHAAYSDITNELATGGGYTAGGKTLTGVTILTDLPNDRSALDADDVTWTAATLTARGAVLYKDTGTPSTSKLILYIDFGVDKTASGGDFTVAFDATGILRLS